MAPRDRKHPDLIPAPLRQQLAAARNALLALHKALLDRERAIYEKSHGPVSNSGAFLQLVIHDPAFAWLHPLSELVVQIDEAEESSKPAAAADAAAILVRARESIRPDDRGDAFQQKYQHAVQDTPEVATAHARWQESADRK